MTKNITNSPFIWIQRKQFATFSSRGRSANKSHVEIFSLRQNLNGSKVSRLNYLITFDKGRLIILFCFWCIQLLGFITGPHSKAFRIDDISKMLFYFSTLPLEMVFSYQTEIFCTTQHFVAKWNNCIISTPSSQEICCFKNRILRFNFMSDTHFMRQLCLCGMYWNLFSMLSSTEVHNATNWAIGWM